MFFPFILDHSTQTLYNCEQRGNTLKNYFIITDGIEMNDFELMKHAKNYIEKMANGINPLTNEPVPETDLLNNISISRCLFYVSGILQNVLSGDQQKTVQQHKPPRKADFSITEEELAGFEFSQDPLTISELTHRINSLVDLANMKPLHYRTITEWLGGIGLLEEKERPTGGLTKRPTESGEQLGIKVEERLGIDGNIYYVNIYDIHAQQYIVDNLAAALAK